MIEAPTLLQVYERAFGPFIHMSQEEKAIWIRWLQKGGSQHAPFTYDVRVGNGLEMPAGSSGYAVRSAYALTTKRIDVLYFDHGTPVIVEVKRRAGLSAVGQLIGYRDLLLKTHGYSGPAAMLLVTDTLQPDMPTVLRDAGIFWNEVGL